MAVVRHKRSVAPATATILASAALFVLCAAPFTVYVTHHSTGHAVVGGVQDLPWHQQVQQQQQQRQQQGPKQHRQQLEEQQEQEVIRPSQQVVRLRQQVAPGLDVPEVWAGGSSALLLNANQEQLRAKVGTTGCST